jgi:F0F1-type ATP synthase assembly protein I
MGPGSGPAWRSVGDLAGIGVAMALSIVIGLAAGYYLDRWLGTGPWLTLSGLGFGIAAAFVSLFRAVRAAERRLDDSE